MPARSPLPDDLWVNLANYLTIDDLYSLCDTCRHLRDVLTGSKAVWVNVIRDLLVPSPNITISISLKAASAFDLKQICNRYRAANRLLDMQSQSAFTLSEDQYFSFALPFAAMDGQLVPGLACIACASSNGSVHLVSTKTGKVVHSWSHPEVDGFQDVTIQICSSETHGVMILAAGKLNQTPGLPWGHLWLLAVDSSSPEPSLVPLMTRPVDQSVITVSARNNTLAYIFEGDSPASNMLAIVELNLPTNDYQQVSPRLYRFGSNFNHLQIYDVVIFFPDVVGVTTANTIALFRICEDHGQIDRHSSPPVLTPYWTHSPEGHDGLLGFFLGPLHVPNPDTCLLALCIHFQSYTLRISRNSSECELHFVSKEMGSLFIPAPGYLEVEVCLQGRGACTIGPWNPRHTMMHIELYRIEHFKRLVQYTDRLPLSQSWGWDLEIPHQTGAHIRNMQYDIGYDEWTGTVVIQARRTDGDEPECFVTVFSLLRVVRAMKQGTLSILIQTAPS